MRGVGHGAIRVSRRICLSQVEVALPQAVVEHATALTVDQVGEKRWIVQAGFTARLGSVQESLDDWLDNLANGNDPVCSGFGLAAADPQRPVRFGRVDVFDEYMDHF